MYKRYNVTSLMLFTRCSEKRFSRPSCINRVHEHCEDGMPAPQLSPRAPAASLLYRAPPATPATAATGKRSSQDRLREFISKNGLQMTNLFRGVRKRR